MAAVLNQEHLYFDPWHSEQGVEIADHRQEVIENKGDR